MLSRAYLKRILPYNPSTGVWRWKITCNGFVAKNSRAGYINSQGYEIIRINLRGYKAHRLAWFYMKGCWPRRVDHKDTRKANNRWKNLRVATHGQNVANSKLRRDSTSGLKGAYFKRARAKWFSAIRFNTKLKHLGYFESAMQAHKAYMKAAKKYFGAFARAQ